MITGVVFLHIVALHITGSNNPLGIDVKSPQDTMPFHPYYTSKDSDRHLRLLLLVFAILVFFAPTLLGDPDEQHPGQPAGRPRRTSSRNGTSCRSTPCSRSVPRKLGGVIMMFSAILVLFFLPVARHLAGAQLAVPPDVQAS